MWKRRLNEGYGNKLLHMHTVGPHVCMGGVIKRFISLFLACFITFHTLHACVWKWTQLQLVNGLKESWDYMYFISNFEFHGIFYSIS